MGWYMKQNRNYGIDLLRVVLMLLIITGHLLIHTGISSNLVEFSSKWFISFGYMSIIVCAVNCFVLITGYFSNQKSYNIKIKKIVLLWGQVLFYSISIYVVLLLLGIIDFSIMDAIHSIFPVASEQYWFFSSYILLMLLMPFLNYMLVQLNDFSLKVLTGIIVIVFYILPIFSIVFMEFDLSRGYGIIGFVTLYIIGYTLKRLKINFSKVNCLVALFINCGIVLSSKIVLTYIVNRLQLEVGSGLLYRYNSLFQLINAILLLLLFKEIHLKGKVTKLLELVSGSIFGVYLIHEHPQIRKLIWNEWLCNKLLQVNLVWYIIVVLILPIIVFIICLILDKLRKGLGKLIGKIGLVRKVDEKLTILESRLKERFEKSLEV